MLRVNVGLSRKLSKDYNSTGYSVNLDGEVRRCRRHGSALEDRMADRPIERP